MNKERRKNIEILQGKIQEVLGYIDEIKCEIEELRDEEQDAYDNLPDSIREGEKGDIMQDAIDNLNYALDCDIETYLEDWDSYLEEAKG